jgi:hypothetical protein
MARRVDRESLVEVRDLDDPEAVQVGDDQGETSGRARLSSTGGAR